ncbi:rhodanese-like domain-containing protein [Thioalkalivibrio sp. ALM2T]|uniref:rhodanese-like domain-containing protein n=1 Tax=Thioalkalivibrio sp. ALM2T TaxID=1158184 RepID=UPI0003777B51|nr:rhodanese-like domain-containing protein [Thioalkalivibrio sp. ALM2T]
MNAFRFIARLGLVLAFLFPFALLADYESPETVDGTTYVGPEEARALFDQRVPFVDVRTSSDYDAGRIPGAINLTVERDQSQSDITEESLLEFVGSKDADVVLYCNSTPCWRTAAAAERAVEWGFTSVHYYRLGFPSWQEAGYPVE